MPGILLPAQITAQFGEADKVANLAIVMTIGAFFAMLAQPIAGQVSDRTRSRFGRRAPWIFIGALAGGLALVGLAFANSLVGVVIAWTLVQITYNFAQGPLSAVMPDRVPLKRRGTFATLSGIGLMVGALGGQVVGSVFLGSITAGYVTFAVFALVILTLFIVFNPDYSSKELEREPFKFVDFLAHLLGQPGQAPRLLLGVHRPPAALHRLLRRDRATSSSCSPTTSASPTPARSFPCSASSASPES